MLFAAENTGVLQEHNSDILSTGISPYLLLSLFTAGSCCTSSLWESRRTKLHAKKEKEKRKKKQNVSVYLSSYFDIAFVSVLTDTIKSQKKKAFCHVYFHFHPDDAPSCIFRMVMFLIIRPELNCAQHHRGTTQKRDMSSRTCLTTAWIRYVLLLMDALSCAVMSTLIPLLRVGASIQ